MNEINYRTAVGSRFGELIAEGEAVFQTGLNGLCSLPCTLGDGEVRYFSGVNLFVLLQVMKDQSWLDPRFFTIEQIQQSGWTFDPDAKKCSLQFFTSTASDGMPLQQPAVKRFQVINGSEIKGIEKYEVKKTSFINSDIETSLIDAGYVGWIEGPTMALRHWLFDLQKAEIQNDHLSASEATMRVQMALLLLEAQTGIASDTYLGSYSGFNSEWENTLKDDPLSFVRAASDAERLAAILSKEITAISWKRQISEEMSSAKQNSSSEVTKIRGNSTEEADMANKDFMLGKIEKMFLDREAILAVPYADKGEAKGLGAMWYQPLSVWFVPNGLKIESFCKWNPNVHSVGVVATRQSMIDSFMEDMEALGLDTSADIKDDGKWHYVSVNTKSKKNLAGAYVLNFNGGKNGEPVGSIMNKHSGESKSWKHDGQLLTPEQRARMRVEVLIKEAALNKELLEKQDTAAIHANEIYSNGLAADNHGYVIKKGISAKGLRQIAGSELLKYSEFYSEEGTTIIRAKEMYLIVPMRSTEGDIRAIQVISSDGVIKSFMRGGQKKGTMAIIGGDSFSEIATAKGSAVAYVEGFATGASFHEAALVPVVVCFDAKNVETIIFQTAMQIPAGKDILIAADNDQFQIERAIGLISEKLGVNPHADTNKKLIVRSGLDTVREVSVGDIICDGAYHEVSKGAYCVNIEEESNGPGVRKITVEIVPNGGKKIRGLFVNPGVESGNASLEFAKQSGISAKLVLPQFDSLLGRPTDWNDLHKREGMGVMRQLIAQQFKIDLDRSNKTRDICTDEKISSMAR